MIYERCLQVWTDISFFPRPTIKSEGNVMKNTHSLGSFCMQTGTDTCRTSWRSWAIRNSGIRICFFLKYNPKKMVLNGRSKTMLMRILAGFWFQGHPQFEAYVQAGISTKTTNLVHLCDCLIRPLYDPFYYKFLTPSPFPPPQFSQGLLKPTGRNEFEIR